MKRLFATLAFLFVCYTIQAQRATVIDTTFQSTAYGKERKLSIYLPPYYEEEIENEYPVMYVFDGQAISFTDMVYGVNAALINYSESVPFIIVGIHSDNRGPELTPKPEKTKKWVNNPDFDWGKGDILEASLVNEIIPFVENKYRSNGFRVGVGHSLGGTFVLNLKAENKGIFHSVIAVSPNLLWDEEVILDKFEQQANSEAGFYYISIGDTWDVEHDFKVGVNRLNYVFSKKAMDYEYEHKEKNKAIIFKIDENEDATHGTNFMLSMPRALIELNRATSISEDEVLEFAQKDDFVELYKQEYQRLAKWKETGDGKPSESMLNNIAYTLSYEEEYDKAIELLNWGIEVYPDAYNLYDSKAEMLMNQGKYDESEQFYKEALKVLKRTKDQFEKEDYDYYMDLVKDNLKKMREKKK